MQAWQGFSLRWRIRQNGLYLIPQSLIRQTSPFPPLGPTSPWWKKEKRAREGVGRQEKRKKWRETVRNFCSHIKGWDSMSEEICPLLCIADAEPLSLLVAYQTFWIGYCNALCKVFFSFSNHLCDEKMHSQISVLKKKTPVLWSTRTCVRGSCRGCVSLKKILPLSSSCVLPSSVTRWLIQPTYCCWDASW